MVDQEVQIGVMIGDGLQQELSVAHSLLTEKPLGTPSLCLLQYPVSVRRVPFGLSESWKVLDVWLSPRELVSQPGNPYGPHGDEGFYG